MRIGIDLGGTKIEGVLLDPNGHEVLRQRVNTPQGDYTETVQAVANLVKTLEHDCTQTPTVGIGIPGTISSESGLVKNANSVCLIGQALDQDLSKAIGREVRLQNDANCFAVSEAHDGAGAGEDVVFGVIIGTGVGAGICVHGQPLTGPNAIAGEWGHNALPWPTDNERPGPECYCGLTGCIETFLSGPGLTRDHQIYSGLTLDGQAIVSGAESGEKACEETLKRYEHRLARALSSIINVLDPNVIILGGGLSNIDRLYDNVPKLWDQWVFSNTVRTKLVKNHFGDSSGVRGAAWLWPID
ncbi:MAG: ROK family protein [Magnetovibrio sp.]|nr:ROK family protein [Magnetovibrio sp.]